MKKFIALLMAAAMVFAMVACNSNTNTPDIDVQTPAPVDSPVTPSEPDTSPHRRRGRILRQQACQE